MAEATSQADGGQRYCPVCGERTELAHCPKDGTTTVVKQLFKRDGLSFLPGDLVAGRYRIEGALGRGAYGAVYSARHTGTGQAVAVKMLTLGDAESVGDDNHVKRFYREARTTAQLLHQNTVRVFDVGQDPSGPLFLVMELLRGPSLVQYLKRVFQDGARMSEPHVIDVAISVLKSLGEAHRAGLVHRDIKPGNVVLHRGPDDETIVKVLDFGIARAVGSSMTATGTSLGTPAFMSPEQCLGNDLDGRSDLYALAVLMFVCVCARLPFQKSDVMALMFQHVNADPPDPREFGAVDLTDDFVALLLRSLRKKPAERFDDAGHMRKLLLEVRKAHWADVEPFGLRPDDPLWETDDVGRRPDRAHRTTSPHGPDVERGTVQEGALSQEGPDEATRASKASSATAMEEPTLQARIGSVTGDDITIATPSAPRRTASGRIAPFPTDSQPHHGDATNVAPLPAMAATRAAAKAGNSGSSDGDVAETPEDSVSASDDTAANDANKAAPSAASETVAAGDRAGSDEVEASPAKSSKGWLIGAAAALLLVGGGVAALGGSSGDDGANQVAVAGAESEADDPANAASEQAAGTSAGDEPPAAQPAANAPSAADPSGQAVAAPTPTTAAAKPADEGLPTGAAERKIEAKIAFKMSNEATDPQAQIDYVRQALKLDPGNEKYLERLVKLEADRRVREATRKAKAHKRPSGRTARPAKHTAKPAKAAHKPAPKPKAKPADELQPRFAD